MGERRGGNPFTSLPIQAYYMLTRATLELGGPEALTPLQVVKIFEKTLGRKFEVQFVPADALEAQQAADK